MENWEFIELYIYKQVEGQIDFWWGCQNYPMRKKSSLQEMALAYEHMFLRIGTVNFKNT